jgi:hypothetical protein
MVAILGCVYKDSRIKDRASVLGAALKSFTAQQSTPLRLFILSVRINRFADFQDMLVSVPDGSELPLEPLEVLKTLLATLAEPRAMPILLPQPGCVQDNDWKSKWIQQTVHHAMTMQPFLLACGNNQDERRVQAWIAQVVSATSSQPAWYRQFLTRMVGYVVQTAGTHFGHALIEFIAALVRVRCRILVTIADT